MVVLFVNNSSMEVDDQPLIEWAPNNAVSVLGWSLEMILLTSLIRQTKSQPHHGKIQGLT